MESLHAPWRIEYILDPNREKQQGFVFADVARSDDDEGNHVIGRTRSSFAILNSYPYNGGHVLVLPYKEVRDTCDLTDEELLDLILLMNRCKQAIAKVMKPDGFNIGINLGSVAGAGIEDHLHIHVVPRWSGDTNFMPVIGKTKILPEALADVAAKLRAALIQ
jgi:ATP adenylyltransferase|tara:strand:- start:144 stop:632 length:489 start_codon:yes stop_codon:yes gene_type:complete